MDAQPIGLGRVAETTEIQAPTLVGDVRDLLLQEMRDTKNALPWTTRSEKEQREMIERADRFSRDLVARAVATVAAGQHPNVRMHVESWTVKDGLKIVGTALASPENIDALVGGAGSGFLVFASAEEFSGERAPIQPLPDQPLLGDEDGPVFDQTPTGKATPTAKKK